ncbi:hypothetical protein FJZ18_01725 [Candidatus Pacearchaeota archaeon]|nr:hypothetical protein [Candidatus Pacearchaeota archaeon]
MELPIAKISLKQHERKTIALAGVIDRVAQTTGPTLFSLVDGSGTLMLKGFDGAGVRAYPHILEGDAVKVTVQINEFQGSLEGEIRKIMKLEGNEASSLRKNIEAEERKIATVHPVPFLVKSPVLEKLKERYIQAATEIRLAIVKNRPIIVRHHNDCDGYSSGYSLERAIIPLIIKQHGGGKAPWEYYTRAPSAAPFYEIEDSIKDTAHSLSDVAKFSNKMPLVVIVDTGSGSESILGIKQGKIHGADFIVVDHHFFEEDVTSPEVLVHINPFLVKEDGSTFSAGMLCTELARFINPDIAIDHLPALSGMADRIDNPSVMIEYLKIAEKKGYTKELLHDIAALIDYVSTKLRFMEAREYIEVVFGDPIDKQKALVSLMNPHIRGLQARGINIAKTTVKRETIGKTTLQLLFVEETFSRNAYPKPGQVVGMIHDFYQEEKKTRNVVSIGVLSDLVTIRAGDDSNFVVHDFLNEILKNAPEAFPEGGGHKQAGALRFVPAQKDRVLDILRSYIKKVQKK